VATHRLREAQLGLRDLCLVLVEDRYLKPECWAEFCIAADRFEGQATAQFAQLPTPLKRHGIACGLDGFLRSAQIKPVFFGNCEKSLEVNAPLRWRKWWTRELKILRRRRDTQHQR
jgi:hypothetical protein